MPTTLKNKIKKSSGGTKIGSTNGIYTDIQVFDGVGLDETILNETIQLLGTRFTYHRINKIDFTKISASWNQNGLSTPEILLLVDIRVIETIRSTIPSHLNEYVSLVAVATPRQLEELDLGHKLIETHVAFDILETPINKNKVTLLFKRFQKHISHKLKVKKLNLELETQVQAMQQLNDIGIALSSQTDIHALLDLILTISMDITNCDSGSLYILQDIPGVEYNKSNYLANKVLCFKHTYNFTKSIPFKEFTMPISDKSLSGYTALTGKSLNIEDVYIIPEDRPYHFNKSFDQSIQYRTKSMLVVPMLNRDKQTIGVIQLINKKRDKKVKLNSEEVVEQQIIPFTAKDEDLTMSFASQAAVAYENKSLYESIKILFEGFIRASVTAIEARDPTTSGHSERVAVLSTGIAEKVSQVGVGIFKDVQFSRQDIQELKYASLLHDFGKIGVREPVLVKAKKLYEPELELLKSRYKILKKSVLLEYSKRKLDYFHEKAKDEALHLVDMLNKEELERIAQLDSYLEFIIKTNEPTVLESSGFDLLKEIKAKTLNDDLDIYPFLTEHEAKRLAIPKGSLGDDERLEIESHVVHTFNFLKQIPWTNDLRNVPKIAFMHHEKLDGSGYPNKVKSEEIPMQSKIMTISDIYDALTANDRPYKRSVPVEKALDILNYEVKAGKVDADLFDLFVKEKVFEAIIPNA